MNLIDVFFSFKGRIGRGAWWFATTVRIVFTVIIFGLSLSAEAGFIIVLWLIFQIWPALAIHVKRWHDRNKSGLWHFIGLVPFIGSLWIIIELRVFHKSLIFIERRF